MLDSQGWVRNSTSEYLSHRESSTVTTVPDDSQSESFRKYWNEIEGATYRNDLYGGGLTSSGRLL